MAKDPGRAQDGRPRYRRLADELIADIRSGRIRVGDTLPGELELVERFAVSRHTVREALRVLHELGLIDRHQGIGTVVRARNSRETYVQTVRSPAELLHYPAESRLVVMSSATVKLDRSQAKLLQAQVGSTWFRIGALRRFRASRLPICWVDLYVLPEFAGVLDLVGRRTQLVSEMIEQKYGERVATVRVDISAGSLNAELAAALQAEPGTPSLTVIRRYTSTSGRLMQVAISDHPTERYTFSLELRRGWQSGDGWSSG
jgi:DNA-binding GntR family transcriptional regulator